LSLSDRESLEVALIENVQRTDLNPIEEATGYNSLISEHGYTHEEIANIVGKSRSHISNTLRLLGLSIQTKALLENGELSAGHARALLTVPDSDILAIKVVKDGLTVRDVERWSNEKRNKSKVRKTTNDTYDVDTVSWENKLQSLLGVNVKVRLGRSGGELTVKFATLEQLQELFERLSRS